MSRRKNDLIRMLLQTLLGALFAGSFIWGIVTFGGPHELVDFMDEIILEYNTNNIYSSIGKWILTAYVFAMPAYGIYYIAASINQFKRSSTVSVESPPRSSTVSVESPPRSSTVSVESPPRSSTVSVESPPHSSTVSVEPFKRNA